MAYLNPPHTLPSSPLTYYSTLSKTSPRPIPAAGSFEDPDAWPAAKPECWNCPSLPCRRSETPSAESRVSSWCETQPGDDRCPVWKLTTVKRRPLMGQRCENNTDGHGIILSAARPQSDLSHRKGIPKRLWTFLVRFSLCCHPINGFVANEKFVLSPF